MANYFVTNTARFNPFTYQEMRAPIAEATAQHYAMAEALASIDDGSLGQYISMANPDSEVATKYASLNDRIRQASDELAATGINGNLIQDIYKIKGDFKRFATPIEAAGKRMTQILADYDKHARSGFMIGENPHDKDLQYFIEHPEYAPQYMEGKWLLSIGTALGQSLAEQFEPKYTLSPDKKYYNIQTKRTATIDEIKNNEEYKNAINEALKSQGFDPNSSDLITTQARQAIEFGVYNSMQDKGIKTQVVPRYGSTSNEGGTSGKRDKSLPTGAIKLDSGRVAKKVQGGGIIEIVKDDNGNWIQKVADEDLRKEYAEFQKKADESNESKYNNISSRIFISDKNATSYNPFITEDSAVDEIYNGTEDYTGIKGANKVTKLSTEWAKTRLGKDHNPNLIYIDIDGQQLAVTKNTLRNIYSLGYSKTAESYRIENKKNNALKKYRDKFIGFSDSDLVEPKE